MKVFIYKVLILCILVFCADRVIGHYLEHISSHLTLGVFGKDNYICNETVDDVLIFGSSRATHHYNTRMLQDSLSLTCFNCGQDANGIILAYGRLLMCRERFQPKLIILDVTSSMDFLEDDNTQYLGWLKDHYNRNGIQPIFERIEREEVYKMHSLLYRQNSCFLKKMLVYYTSYVGESGKFINGYNRLNGTMNPIPVSSENHIEDDIDVDSLKLYYLNEFIKTARDSKIVFVYSPYCSGVNENEISFFKDFCKERDVPFIDFSNNPKYLYNFDYFVDVAHLNSLGADEFTKDLISRLRTIYKL